MTKLTSTPAGAVLVAIDMSKSRQEVLIERPEGGRRRRMTVMATRQDYDGFAEQLAAIGRPIIVGFEATGNYHRTLAHRLLTAGFELRLISSVALARTREALHNGWDKNDPKDAQVILHMLRIGATQRYVDPLAAGINDLASITLMSDGARVYLCTTQDEVMDLLGRGQGVFGIAIGRVLREVEASLVNMKESHVDDMDELAARRLNRKAV